MNRPMLPPVIAEPRQSSYDVVIVGGAIMGSSAAFWLSINPDFDGSILVVERDPSYENSSTARTNSCMRQQFSNPLNIQISQFTADFVHNFRDRLGGDPEIPDIGTQLFGYMYLADNDEFAERLRQSQQLQESLGGGTKIMAPAEIAEAYPFYNMDGIVCGSHNLVNEGYFDGGTMFDWLRRQARRNGAEYITNEVAGIDHDGTTVTSVTLTSGEQITCGHIVNAAGPRAADVAALAGFELPVEPRKRFTFVFNCAEDLGRDLPLTIDPTGVHVRSDGDAFLAGCPPFEDARVEYDDFSIHDDVWEEKIWPAIANRVPAFERIKVTSKWAGHYAYNTLDHNVVIGPHPEMSSFIFMNGFSGHGLQQNPAMGRAVSELITYGEFRTLDMTPLGYHRIIAGEPFVETAII